LARGGIVRILSRKRVTVKRGKAWSQGRRGGETDVIRYEKGDKTEKDRLRINCTEKITVQRKTFTTSQQIKDHRHVGEIVEI